MKCKMKTRARRLSDDASRRALSCARCPYARARACACLRLLSYERGGEGGVSTRACVYSNAPAHDPNDPNTGKNPESGAFGLAKSNNVEL